MGVLPIPRCDNSSLPQAGNPYYPSWHEHMRSIHKEAAKGSCTASLMPSTPSPGSRPSKRDSSRALKCHSFPPQKITNPAETNNSGSCPRECGDPSLSTRHHQFGRGWFQTRPSCGCPTTPALPLRQRRDSKYHVEGPTVYDDAPHRGRFLV